VEACVCCSSQSASRFTEDGGEVEERGDVIEPEGSSLLFILTVQFLEFNIQARSLILIFKYSSSLVGREEV